MNEVSIPLARAHSYTAERAILDSAALEAAFSERPLPNPFERIAMIRRTIAARAGRKRICNARLFSDPAWDMLLELYVASLAQRRLQLSRLCERAGVAQSTGIRWLGVLEREGLLTRGIDRLDGRVCMLSLTDAGRKAMDDYFDTLPLDAAVL